jgi:uridine kinase
MAKKPGNIDKNVRLEYIDCLARQITSIPATHPLRVGIDGVDAAGKSTLADELADHISVMKRPVVRASIDGFHQPKGIRYQRGSLSPHGYFQDSFQYDRLIELVLTPLGPGGSRIICTRIFDYRRNIAVAVQPQAVPEDTILIFDGIFLLRVELRVFWDVTIFVKVTFETYLSRALKRDRVFADNENVIQQKYLQRYIPAQEYYLHTCQPESYADFTWDNEDPTSPILTGRSP